jgi:cytochrome c biogenesis protein CcdA/thiol-disulfide isomerase/thioredoxin
VITLVLIGLVGGLITGISPCVLPVLPVIFLSGGVRSGVAAGPRLKQAGTRQGKREQRTEDGQPDRWRPYLIVAGLAISFSIFTLLGTLVLSALPLPNDIIRWTGLVVLVLLGIAMMFPIVQDLLERPFARIRQREVSGQHSGFVLGLALGAVYVPCAGPVLAAITVAGATGKIGWRTVALTVAFAIGTAIPLLFFALAGRGVAERVRAFRDRQRIVQVAAGLVVIGLAVALTFNVTDALQRTVPDYTASLNKALNNAGAEKDLGSQQSEALAQCAQEPATTLQNCGKAPAISGTQQWFNTPGNTALPATALTGKVYLVDFWAYSCINCQRAIPHVEAWYSAYQNDGLEVIGVHTPEYAFEHVASDVAAGVKRLNITYPVAQDNNYTTWNNFGNDSWPAEYLVDASGIVRHVSIGEGDYSGTESLIRQLLTAANPSVALPPATDVADKTPNNPLQTPETYLGSERAQTLANNVTLGSGDQTFTYPSAVPADDFALTGTWTVSDESLTAKSKAGIELNFDASNVYLDVGGTGTITTVVNGKVSTMAVSGAPDIYTVFSAGEPERTSLTVQLSPGLSAYSFTFG